MSQKAQILFNVSAIVPGNTVSFNLSLNGSSSTTYTFTAVDHLTTPGPNQFQIGPPGSEYIAAKGNLEALLAGLTGFLTYYTFVGGGSTPYSIGIRAVGYGDIFNFGTFTGSSGIFFESQQSNVVDPITASATPTNVICFGVNNGTINVTVSGGADPFTFLWNDGATTQNRTALGPGTYSVVITDSLGTTYPINDIVITAPANAISIGHTKQNALCNGADNGLINITPSGGTPGYTFLWNDGSTSQNRSGLAPGTYSVTVTDSVGCTNTLSSIVITEPDLISVVATVEENNINLAVYGGTAPYTFLWNDGSTDQNRTGVVPGDYEVTVTDANGCVAFASTVTVESYQFYWSKNPVILELQALDPGSKPNLTFICEVWVEQIYKSESYQKIITLEQPADSSGATVFDVQVALDAYVEPNPPWAGQNSIQRATKQFKRFYLKYTEKFGTPPVESTYTQVNKNYVVLGGLSEEEYAANTWFTTYQPVQRPFLTWQPTVKEVFKDQPEFLYFMVDSFSLSAIMPMIKIYYTDGTSDTQNLSTQSPVSRYEVFMIPCGFNQRNLSFYETANNKTIKAWDIWVATTGYEQISEIRKFKLNTKYTPVKRYLYYLNSLGSFDTLCATAKAKKTLSTDEVVAEKILPHDRGISDADFEIINKVGVPELKLSTGYISKEYSERLQDFVMSKVYYLIQDERLIPVKINMRTAEIDDEDSTLYSIDFTIELPKISNYTPRL